MGGDEEKQGQNFRRVNDPKAGGEKRLTSPAGKDEAERERTEPLSLETKEQERERRRRWMVRFVFGVKNKARGNIWSIK